MCQLWLIKQLLTQKKLLLFALTKLLHFASNVTTFCDTITFCIKSYYILRYHYILWRNKRRMLDLRVPPQRKRDPKLAYYMR